MARGPLFAIKAQANPRRDTYRAAVVVSRKVSKSAVARNRMRRRLYASVRGLSGRFTGAHDIVITVFNDGVLEAPSAELTGQLKKQFKELGVIK
jgi:ribonuclease P protein component